MSLGEFYFLNHRKMKKAFTILLFLIGSISSICATNLVIDLSKLVERNDSAFYQGKPFSGVAVLNSVKGKIVLETTYKNGLPNGLEITYYDNGNKRSESMMKNGKYNGKVKHYYETGKIKSSETYKDDYKFGPAIYYYENGQVSREGIYSDCKEIGVWIEYYKNGVKKSEGHFEEAQKTGEWKYWDKNGKLIKTENLSIQKSNVLFGN